MDEQNKERIQEKRTQRKVIRCVCGHRYGTRPQQILSKDDSYWRCEFCRKKQ